MRNALSAIFCLSVLSVLWMAAGHAWAGTLLGIAVAAFFVLSIAAIVDFIG